MPFASRTPVAPVPAHAGSRGRPGRAVRLAVVLLVALGACGPSGSPGDEAGGGPRKVSLQLNWFPEPEFGGFYAAREEGLFAEHGLDVTLLVGGPDVPTIQLLAAGNVDFAIVAADELVQARARDVPVVALFAVYQTNPQGIMVHADSGITDLGGVFAARTPKLTLAMMDLPYVAWLRERYGFEHVRRVAYAGGVAQFVRDPNFAQQCFVTSEPYAAAEAGAPNHAFLIADSGFNPYATVVAVTERTLRERPDVCRRMIAAVRAGWDAYLADPEPTNAAMLPLNPGETATSFRQAATRQQDLILDEPTRAHGVGHMTLERWATLVREMRTVGAIATDVDPASCFTLIDAEGARGEADATPP